MALARAGMAEGYWLRADRQSGGRGRLGRQWESPVGNLYASTLVRIRTDDPPAPSLAFIAGVACHEALRPLAGQRSLRLKWPNDLLLDGAKCAGMLLEREGDVVVLGIGVNLATAPMIAGRETASFRDGDGPMLDPAALLVDLAQAFATALNHWRLKPLAATLGVWNERAHALGTPLTVSLGQDERLQGCYAGLADDGALQLQLADGNIRLIHAADVEIMKEWSESHAARH